MMTQGLEFTDVPPFKDVVIHGLVRDSQGRKMSKTLGNGVDPIDIIDKYGADALRFSVISGTTMGNDIRFMEEKLEQASNFANKIWNASKFIMNSLVEEEKIKEFFMQNINKETNKLNDEALRIEDKWIIAKCNELIKEVTKNLENYELGIALDKIYTFAWNEFCDWYIEIVKPRLYSENEEEKVRVCFTLVNVFTNVLKLLHPFMPFITSKIYSAMIQDENDIMISHFPMAMEDMGYEKEETFMETMKQIITEIRNVRANMNIHPSRKSELIFVTDNGNQIMEAKDFILKLGFGSEIKVQNNKDGIKENAIKILKDNIELYIPFEGLVDFEAEKQRLLTKKEKIQEEAAKVEAILTKPGFIDKAPEKVVNEQKKKFEEYKTILADIDNKLASM